MKYCVIGEKLTHSMSPQIHKAYFDYYGKDGSYEIRQIPMESMVGDCSAVLNGYDGFNVTVPYKEKVMRYLSGISSEAKEIGAVNTVVNAGGGRLYGYNTDPYGFENLLKVNSITIKGKSFVILGSGGTSKSVAYILKKRGAASVKIATRDNSKTGGDFITYDDLPNMHADTLVNTTPVGMYPNIDNCPVSEEIVARFESVVDIIYNPVYTKLLERAVSLGKKAVGGLYMLVAQAMKSQEIWSNSVSDEALTKSIYNMLIKDYFKNNGGNIYLTGIMSCGKTVKGRRAAKMLGWEFIDLDEYIEKISSCTVSELFDQGECVFRDWESKAIYELSHRKNLVIATGGGAILRDCNVSAMKLSGILILIERKLEDILSNIRTDTRPLLKDGADKLRSIYEKRKDRYYSTCDVVVKSHEYEIHKTVKDIVNVII